MFLQVEGFSSERRLKEQNKALILHVSAQFGAEFPSAENT